MPSVTVGLRACSPARPRHPASLPICVPSVERLPATLSRRLLAETTWRFGYGWRHYPRREPFTPIDQTPAGHTSADAHIRALSMEAIAGWSSCETYELPSVRADVGIRAHVLRDS